MRPKRFYWDTSCFIALLRGDQEAEEQRASICANVLRHAEQEQVEIWTSAWTIVETIRPKEPYTPSALPPWSEALKTTDAKGVLIHPNAISELQRLVDYHARNTAPSHNVPEDKIAGVKKMFSWPFLKFVQVVPTIANHAQDIARQYNLKPGDAIHVASALAAKCERLQRWDKDFDRTDALIPSEKPVRLSSEASSLFG